MLGFCPLFPCGERATLGPSEGRAEGAGGMKIGLCHERAHAARGSNFLLRRQKKVTKEKATPTFAPIRDLKRKRRAVRNSLRSDNGPLHRRFHSKSRGQMNGDPVEPIFDRCAIDSQEPGCEHPPYTRFGSRGEMVYAARWTFEAMQQN